MGSGLGLIRFDPESYYIGDWASAFWHMFENPVGQVQHGQNLSLASICRNHQGLAYLLWVETAQVLLFEDLRSCQHHDACLGAMYPKS